MAEAAKTSYSNESGNSGPGAFLTFMKEQVYIKNDSWQSVDWKLLTGRLFKQLSMQHFLGRKLFITLREIWMGM